MQSRVVAAFPVIVPKRTYRGLLIPPIKRRALSATDCRDRIRRVVEQDEIDEARGAAVSTRWKKVETLRGTCENIQFDVTEEYIKDVWRVHARYTLVRARAHRRHRLRDFLRDGWLHGDRE